jgi:hypothetical protein
VDVFVVWGFGQCEVGHNHFSVCGVDVKTLYFSDEIAAFDHEVILAAAEDACASVCVFDLILYLD